MSIRDAFAQQSEACAKLGSPFMQQLMRAAGARLDRQSGPGRFILDWQGDPGPSADSIPLRFAGALHRLVLGGDAKNLAAVYPPNEVATDTLWTAVRDVLETHGDQIIAFMASPPQTNEIRRSTALIPALHHVSGATEMPLVLSELGASAGLNLLCDQFRLNLGAQSFGPAESSVQLNPDSQGTPPSPASLRITDRAGVDLRPFDLTKQDERLRLLSYLWPDQPERMANTKAALELALAQNTPVDQSDAIDWLATRLDTREAGVCHVIYHTIAWQYFPSKVKEMGEDLIARHGSTATAERPLARVAMEADNLDEGAGLTVQIWPDGTKHNLARVDFHGRWIRWLS